MTVLVTGGAGYIGSHTVLALVEAGESVVVIDNLSTGFSSFVPEGVPLFIGDAGDENLVEGVIASQRVDAIIHFAGSVIVSESMRDPLGLLPQQHHDVAQPAERGGEVRREATSSSPRPRRCTAIRTARRSPKKHRPGRCRPMAAPS